MSFFPVYWHFNLGSLSLPDLPLKSTAPVKCPNAILDRGNYQKYSDSFYVYGIWPTPLSGEIYIHLIYTSEQLRVTGLAQGPGSGSLAALGLELTTF